MDYKKRLKQRLYVAYAEVATGILLIAGALILKPDNYFFSSCVILYSLRSSLIRLFK